MAVARERLEAAKPAADEAKQSLADARKREEEAKLALEQANSLLHEKVEMADAIEHAKNEKEALVRAAKKEAENDANAVFAKEKELEQVEQIVKKNNSTEELRSHGQCQALFAQCGPVDGVKLTKYMGCCVTGCVCTWRDKYYAQCRGPNGEGYCAGETERAWNTKQVSKAVQLAKELSELRKINATKERAYAELDEAANDIRIKAAQAGIEKARAQKLANRANEHYVRESEAALRAEELARSGHDGIHFAELAVEAWRKAAAGASCNAGGGAKSTEADA